MKDIYIFDLDGTLADGTHRLHLLPAKDVAHRTEAWDEFNLAAGKDAPFLDNIELMNELYQYGKRIVILTGRGEVAKSLTEKWLWERGCNYNQLIMRPKDDHRKDIHFKEDKLKEIGLHRIVACFDDLEHVAKHIRSLGVTCHLVTHYETSRVDINGTHYPASKVILESYDSDYDYGFDAGYNAAIEDTKVIN